MSKKHIGTQPVQIGRIQYHARTECGRLYSDVDCVVFPHRATCKSCLKAVKARLTRKLDVVTKRLREQEQ